MMEASSVRVIDTLNFIPMALSNFPKTFVFTELKKGYFPHFFNTTENWDYECELPAVEHYGANAMKDDSREKFLSWYEAENSKSLPFNLQKELEEYCESDVNILAKSALKFRDIFIKVCFID